MEREAYVTDAPIGLRLLQGLDGADTLRALPASAVERMEQIEIEVIHVESFELRCQEAIEVLRLLIEPCGRLACYIHLLAVPVFKRPTENDLGRTADIVVRGVEVVDTPVDRFTDHSDGRFDVHVVDSGGVVGLPAAFHGQAHDPEPQRRHLDAGFPHFPQLHDDPLSYADAFP